MDDEALERLRREKEEAELVRWKAKHDFNAQRKAEPTARTIWGIVPIGLGFLFLLTAFIKPDSYQVPVGDRNVEYPCEEGTKPLYSGAFDSNLAGLFFGPLVRIFGFALLRPK